MTKMNSEIKVIQKFAFMYKKTAKY